MSDLYDKVASDQDPLTKLIGKIPGFKGYIERSSRRAADKILRGKITSEFSILHKQIGQIQQDMASSGELIYLDDLETAATKIQTFMDKISNAAYGYSGFFDAIKINEDELANIYQFDLVLMESGEEIKRAIDNVEASIDTDGLPAAIRHLVSLTRELVNTFEQRDEVLSGIE